MSKTKHSKNLHTKSRGNKKCSLKVKYADKYSGMRKCEMPETYVDYAVIVVQVGCRFIL